MLLVGGGIIVAHWLPRFVSTREPAASALLIAAGWLLALAAPGLAMAVDPVANARAWEWTSELCVIVGLFGVGIRIDRIGGWALWRPTARLLAVTMPLSIAAVALIGLAGGLTIAAALLLGAVLAPTDPVLAGDVQVGPPLEGGEHPVRFALTTEAGLNDGLAFPFVHLGIAVVAAGGLAAMDWGHWFLLDVVWRILAGIVAGGMIGWLLGKLLFAWPSRSPLAESEAGVVALAGVLVAYGGAELVKGYGFLAAFTAAVVLRRVEGEHEFHGRLHDFMLTLEHTLTALLLVALGAALPVLLPALTPAAWLVAVGLLFVIRPAAAWLSLAGLGMPTRERAVIAFYGVRGIGSIYYLAYAGAAATLADERSLWAIVALTILLSTVVHGLTAGLVVERATGETPD